jgi:hypothetical protein
MAAASVRQQVSAADPPKGAGQGDYFGFSWPKRILLPKGSST